MRQAAITLTTTLALCAAGLPAAQAAEAATSKAAISNVVVTTVALDAEPWVTNNWPWIAQNLGAGWPATAESTGASASLADAALHDQSIGWIGTPRSAAVAAANASASASVSFAGADLSSPGAAASFASASGGEVASATARLWDAAFMVGARTRVVVAMTLGELSATGNGGTALALATLGIWNSNGSNFVNAQAQVIDSPDFSISYTGPSTLSVSWDNASTDMAVAHIALMTSAQAISAVSAVPEPASAWMLGLGLAALAVRRRRATAT